MKKIITILTLFLFHTALASAQCVSGPAPSPRTVVEQLWMMATQGDLLTSEGWDKAAKSLFLDPKPTPGNKPRLFRCTLLLKHHWTLHES
jgi:hypothetical protein